jgi:hypothetical protein
MNYQNVQESIIPNLGQEVEYSIEEYESNNEIKLKAIDITLPGGEYLPPKWLLFEKEISAFLEKNGIRFKYEPKLRKREEFEERRQNHSASDIRKAGSIAKVPDFLLLDDIYINGILINWIDAKSYMVPSVGDIAMKLKHQISNFYEDYGTGLIIAQYGDKFRNNNDIMHLPDFFK